MAMSRRQLSVEGVDVVVDGAWTVRELFLGIDEGQALALLGGPAAGKSTLLEAIAGRRAPSRGDIRLDGRSLAGRGPAALLELGIAHAGQRPALFPGLDIGQHLRLGHLTSRSQARAAQARVLRLIPELAGRLGQKVEELDRGRARLVDVGRALMSAPWLLLLDEPSLDLDGERLERLARALAEEGIAVLLAERYPYPALRLAERACLMVSGRIVAEGSAAEVAGDSRLVPACTGELSL
ncbi:MAG TPA: ATP-binding cassette domain-containing protein [Geminicoccaceae bacterium]|nr:ATP-binding cassette domain-containing protein [Geminicoccus sp.]HMU52979.1 ATP-binding cassette domain-containing protein [Geminicoccaceae bacterium]